MFTTVGAEWSVLDIGDENYPVFVCRGRYLRPNGTPIGRRRVLGVTGGDLDLLFIALETTRPFAGLRFAELEIIEIGVRSKVARKWGWLEARMLSAGRSRELANMIDVRFVEAPESVWRRRKR